MACEICGCSCSLCPWCGTNTCPKVKDAEPSCRYYIYAVDRKGSYLIEIYKTNSKQELLNTLNKIKEGKFKRSWAKKFQYCYDTGELVGDHYPNFKSFYIPKIELTITSYECNWDTAVDLLYDIEAKELYRYKGNVTEDNFKITTPWNGKLVFRRQR